LRRAWYDLIPDTNHVVVTAGFGTFDTNADIHLVNNNDYATAARTADGSLVMAYMPTARTLTVDMSKLSGPAVAHWYDPANSTYLSISGSPFVNSGPRDFTPSGNNSDGDGDWILVLETNPPPIIVPPIKPAFIQQAYSVPQTQQLSVSVSYPQSQAVGNANLLAIGWNDAVASITNVSDSASNIYQIAVPTFRGNGMSQAIYYCPNIKSGSNTVTAKFNQPAVFVDLRITEYSGLSKTNTFETGTSGTGNGTTASSGRWHDRHHLRRARTGLHSARHHLARWRHHRGSDRQHRRLLQRHSNPKLRHMAHATHRLQTRGPNHRAIPPHFPNGHQYLHPRLAH